MRRRQIYVWRKLYAVRRCLAINLQLLLLKDLLEQLAVRHIKEKVGRLRLLHLLRRSLRTAGAGLVPLLPADGARPVAQPLEGENRTGILLQ